MEEMKTAVNGIAQMFLVQRFEREWPEEWKKFQEAFEASSHTSFKAGEGDFPSLVFVVNDDIAVIWYPPTKGIEDYL